jgi:hypothetical protein
MRPQSSSDLKSMQEGEVEGGNCDLCMSCSQKEENAKEVPEVDVGIHHPRKMMKALLRGKPTGETIRS